MRGKNPNIRKIKLIIWVIILVIGVVSGAIAYLGRAWNGTDRFTRIVIADQISIESFDPQTKEGIIINLPEDMMISTVNGRGDWRVSALRELRTKYGDKWLNDSIADTLGISYTMIGEFINWWDKLVWWKWNNQIEWRKIDLINSGVLTKKADADGAESWWLSEIGEKKIADWFYSSTTAKEGIAVIVVNTTGVEGLGNHAARVINNAGIRVSAVDNTNEAIDKCQVVGKKEADKWATTKWLTGNFDCSFVVMDNDSDEVILKLGKQYSLWWKGD